MRKAPCPLSEAVLLLPLVRNRKAAGAKTPPRRHMPALTPSSYAHSDASVARVTPTSGIQQDATAFDVTSVRWCKSAVTVHRLR